MKSVIPECMRRTWNFYMARVCIHKAFAQCKFRTHNFLCALFWCTSADSFDSVFNGRMYSLIWIASHPRRAFHTKAISSAKPICYRLFRWHFRQLKAIASLFHFYLHLAFSRHFSNSVAKCAFFFHFLHSGSVSLSRSKRKDWKHMLGREIVNATSKKTPKVKLLTKKVNLKKCWRK